MPEITYVRRQLALHLALERHPRSSCHHSMDTALGRVGLPKHPATESVEPYRLPRLGRPEKEQRNLHLFWGKSFRTRNSAMKAELYQWQAGWTKEDNEQREGRMGILLISSTTKQLQVHGADAGPTSAWLSVSQHSREESHSNTWSRVLYAGSPTNLHSARAHLFTVWDISLMVRLNAALLLEVFFSCCYW